MMEGGSRTKAASTSPTEGEVRQVIAAGMRTKIGEIENKARAQVERILANKEILDPGYKEGLREAISAGLAFGLTTIEGGESQIPPIPAPLLAQARLAAQNGLELGIVLRRYVAGYTLFDDFVTQEAASAGIGGAALAPVLRTQRRALNRLLDAVSEEHAKETAARLASSEDRLAQRIMRMLDGESVDASEIPYDFNGKHLGIVTSGPEARRQIQAVAQTLDRVALVIPRPDGSVYAWLGGRNAACWDEIECRLRASWPADISMAFGELAVGKSGWQLSHEQARAAFPIALRAADRIVRYADVALEASMSQDDLLVSSMRRIYLSPLTGRRDREKIQQTLRAYLDSNRSVSIAATKLKISRETVRNRLDVYEELIGRSLDQCMGSVQAALRLEELGYLGKDL